MNLTDHGLYLSYQGRNITKIMHSGSSAEWKVGIGGLGYFVAMIIHDMYKCINTPLPPTKARNAEQLRPPLNKKLFPVHRPGGLKRAYWNLFFHIFKKDFFFTFPPVHSSL